MRKYKIKLEHHKKAIIQKKNLYEAIPYPWISGCFLGSIRALPGGKTEKGGLFGFCSHYFFIMPGATENAHKDSFFKV